MVCAGGVRVVFRVGAVRNDKYLHVLVESASCPETVPLIAVYLVERFFQLYATSFQFNVYEGESVYKYGHVVPRVIVSAFLDILVDDLNEIVVDILLVDEVDVTAFPVVPLQDLDVIFLYSGGLGYNIIVLVGNALVEEVLPFVVSETVVVQLLQTCAEIGYEVRLRMDRQILIALLPKEPDELLLQLFLTLVRLGRAHRVLIFRDHSVFCAFSNDIVLGHRLLSFFKS